MKRLSMLLLLLLGTALSLHAQVIVYNYETSRYDSGSSCCIAKCATIKYKLKNINLFAKKVIINGSLVSISSPMPEQLQTLFNTKEADVQKKLDNTQDQLNEMKAVDKDASLKATPTATAAMTTLANETNRLVEACTTYYQKADKIDAALRVEKILLETMAQPVYLNATAMRDALNKRGINTAAIAQLRADYGAFTAAYSTAYAQYEVAAAAARNAGDKTNQAKIEEAETEVEKDYKALKKLYTDTLEKIDSLSTAATDQTRYEFTSEPISPDDDTDAIEFSIKTGDRNVADNKLPELKKRLWVHGGWKVDYSVGAVANFIRNDQYFFGPRSGTDTTSVLQARPSNTYITRFTPTVASMIHFYKRPCKGVAFGGMFGVNAALKELTDLKLGFLGGVSVLLGHTRKIVISSGISYLPVNRLKEGQYQVGQPYKGVKIEDVTEQVLRPSWFVAFSLSIGKATIRPAVQ